MNKILLTVLFALLILINAENALACFCSPNWGKKSLQERVNLAFWSANFVFSGEVIEIKRLPTTPIQLEIKLKNENIWKGKFSSEEILINTFDDNAMCGYTFKTGSKYFIYAYGKDEHLDTDICTRTAFLKGNKDIKILDKLKILRESKKPFQMF